jgi:hypothetical protein
MEMACRFCGHPIYYTGRGDGEYAWSLVMRERDDTFVCQDTMDAQHEPMRPIVRGGSVWLVTEFSGPEASRCISDAITHAKVTGSVGATFRVGGDATPEPSSATVVGLIERKPG